MTEGVSYKLSIQDFMSGALGKLRSNSRIVFNGIQSDINRTGKEMDFTTRNVAVLERYMKGLERRRKISIDDSEITAINRKLQAAEARIKSISNMGRIVSFNGGSMGGSGGKGLGAVAGFSRLRLAGAAAVAGGVMLAGGMFKSSSAAGMENQANRITFETIAGQRAGSQLYDDVSKYAQQTIYGKEQFGMAKTQLAFGMDAKQVMPNLRMLGDVAAGDAQRMEALNLAFSQVKSNERLTGNDLLQFVGAGFNPLQEISRTTGRSMKDLREDMSKGVVTFEQVRGAFVSATAPGGKFYQMVDKIAKTDFGKKAIFQGNFDNTMIRMGQSTAPIVGKFLDQYGNKALQAFDKSIPSITRMLEAGMSVLPAVQNLVEGGAKLIRPVLGMLTSDTFTSLARNSINVVANLVNGLEPAVKSVTSAFEFLGKILNPIVSILGSGTQADIDSRNGFEGWGITPDGYRKFKQLEYIKDAGKGLTGANAIGFTNMLMPYAAKAITEPTMGQGFPFINPMLRTNNMAGAAMAALQNKNSLSAVMSAMGGSGTVGGAGSTDAITGGGRKTVIINFNKELISQGGVVMNMAGGANVGVRELTGLIDERLRLIFSSIEDR